MEFNILYIKALHIIFVVTWFAGLFYIVRLFVYHAEAKSREEPASSILRKQYRLMEWRLWYLIAWPSALLAMTFGWWMVFDNMAYLKAPWMLLKLGLVGALFLYHLFCHRIFSRFRDDTETWGSARLRLWNEVATLFLFAIVFIVVLKHAFNWIWGMGGLLILAAVLMLAVRLYGRSKSKEEGPEDGSAS